MRPRVTCKSVTFCWLTRGDSPASAVSDCLGRGVSCDKTKFELDPDLVGVATGDPSSHRRFLIVADGDPVARLGVESWVGRTGAVADPRTHP